MKKIILFGILIISFRAHSESISVFQNNELIETKNIESFKNKIIRMTDKNFSWEGLQDFRVVSLVDFFESLKINHYKKDVFFIAQNNYVCRYSPFIESMEIVIAFQQSGKRIKNKNGGPLKMLSQDDRFLSEQSCWYLKTVVVNEPNQKPMYPKNEFTESTIYKKNIDVAPNIHGFQLNKNETKLQKLVPKNSNMKLLVTSLLFPSSITIDVNQYDLYIPSDGSTLDISQGGPLILKSKTGPEDDIFFVTKIQK